MFKFVTKDTWVGNRVRQFKMVDHPGAAATLVVQDGRVLLVEQYRPAAGRHMLELPAGTIDRSEPPIDCAQRELQEETATRPNTGNSSDTSIPPQAIPMKFSIFSWPVGSRRGSRTSMRARIFGFGGYL